MGTPCWLALLMTVVCLASSFNTAPGVKWLHPKLKRLNERHHHHKESREVNAGYFWHVTDMHWDPTYSEDAAGLACNDQTDDDTYGKYGDYLCDAPWTLINSSVYAMRDIEPDPDFLIWTGDDTPHIYNDTILNQEVVKDIIFNLTDLLVEVFPEHMVYSALGNHDWSPKHQLPPNPDPLYHTIADKWHMWLTEQQANVTFRKGGYYVLPGVRSNVSIVVLNTNLYYTSNALTEDMPDPANQLQWLDNVLTESAEAGTKVMLVAHMPPGQFEKHADWYWFYPHYNALFVMLLKQHSDTIGSIHIAHHHTDSFRIVYDDEGTPVGTIFLGPSVTPWETTLPDVMGGAGNNPSIRLVKYDRDTGTILDIDQYYLNLPSANELDSDEWSLLYEATAYYDIPDLSPASMAHLAEDLLTDDELFSRYYLANGVAYDPEEEWTEDYRAVHYCAITRLDYEQYGQCIDQLMQGTGGSSGLRLSSWLLHSSAIVSSVCLAMWGKLSLQFVGPPWGKL